MALIGLGGTPALPAVTAILVLSVLLAAAVWATRRALRGRDGSGFDPVLRSALDGALISLGVLAVVDNLVFHWLLEFHRFKEGWDGSIYVEALLVGLGTVMVLLGIRDLRRNLRRTSTVATDQHDPPDTS